MHNIPAGDLTEEQRRLLIYRWNTINSDMNGRIGDPEKRTPISQNDMEEMLAIEAKLDMRPDELVQDEFKAVFGTAEAPAAFPAAMA